MFKINYKLKKRININNGKKIKSVRIIILIKRILLYWSAIIGLLYVFLNLIISDWSTYRMNGEIKKNYEYIFIVGSIIISFGFLICLFLNQLIYNISGKNVGERTNEELAIKDDLLIYIFRIKFQNDYNERFKILIPISNINDIEIDIESKCLIFKGNIDVLHYNNYFLNNIFEKNIINMFILYDYFSPSLITYIKNFYK